MAESRPMTSPARTAWLAGRVHRRRWADLVPWLVPAAVALAVAKLSEHRLEEAIAGGVALLVLRWAYRHPGASLSLMVVMVTVQGVAFGALYALHVPALALRAGGGLKDLLGIGILSSAVVHMRRTHQRIDWLDTLALAYIGVVTVYLLLPALFAPFPLPLTDRLLSWRLDAGYVLLFFALRHAPISPAARQWLLRVIMGLGALVIGFAVYQFASPHGFEHLIVDTWKQAAYEQNVLHSQPTTILSTLHYVLHTSGGVHVGSILISPYAMGDYLVVVAAVILERLVRGHRGWVLVALLGGVVFSLFVSKARADAVAFLVVLVVALLPARGRPVVARWGMVLAIAIGAALLVPFLSGSRFLGGGTATASTSAHLRELASGVATIGRYPLGLGLGNNPVISNRFTDPGAGLYTSDNSVLQVGDEMGVLALAAWLPFVVGTFVALRRRARAPDTFAAVAALALLGVLVSGMFHHVFLGFTVAWTLWPLIGVALRPQAPAPRRFPQGGHPLVADLRVHAS